MNTMNTCTPLWRVNPRILLPLLIALHLAALMLIVKALDGEEQPSGSNGQVASLNEAQVHAYCEPRYESDDFAAQTLIGYRQADIVDAPQQHCVNFQ